MVAQRTSDAYTRQLGVLGRLIGGKQLVRYALFFEIDADTLPDGSPEIAGYVLDQDGQTYWFELGWDATRAAPSLTTWKPVPTEPAWWRAEEYLAARCELGLQTAAHVTP